MALAPGFMPDLGDKGRAGWTAYLQQIIQESINSYAPQHVVASDDPDLLPDVSIHDWNAHPIRVGQSIDRPASDVDKLLDWAGAGQQRGRVMQEEYLEWRVVRRPSDRKIVRIEFTSETPDYWRMLARYEPAKVIQLVARFANEAPENIDPRLIWGDVDPFRMDPDDPQQGASIEAAYRSQMQASGSRPPLSPYNNGLRAITHMQNGFNSIAAAVSLAISAAHPYARREGANLVAASGNEAVATLPQGRLNVARCRNSDPSIAGAIIAEAFGNKKIALADPFGVYITSIAHSQLRINDVDRVPLEWFLRERGLAAEENAFGLPTFQRVVFQVPPGLGFVVGDLRGPDGRNIETGGQVARLINVALCYRTSREDVVNAPPKVLDNVVDPPCDRDQEEARFFVELWEEFKRAPQGLSDAAPIALSMSRRL